MGYDEKEKILLKRISSSFLNASPSRLKQGEEAAQQEFIPAFFLKRKTYNQSGRKRNNLSSCVSYLRRKPGSLKYSCESGSKRLPGSHDASQNRRSLGEDT